MITEGVLILAVVVQVLCMMMPFEAQGPLPSTEAKPVVLQVEGVCATLLKVLVVQASGQVKTLGNPAREVLDTKPCKRLQRSIPRPMLLKICW